MLRASNNERGTGKNLSGIKSTSFHMRNRFRVCSHAKGYFNLISSYFDGAFLSSSSCPLSLSRVIYPGLISNLKFNKTARAAAFEGVYCYQEVHKSPISLRPILALWRQFPTDTLTSLGPQNPWIDEFYDVEKRRSSNFEALKYGDWAGRASFHTGMLASHLVEQTNNSS